MLKTVPLPPASQSDDSQGGALRPAAIGKPICRAETVIRHCAEYGESSPIRLSLRPRRTAGRKPPPYEVAGIFRAAGGALEDFLRLTSFCGSPRHTSSTADAVPLPPLGKAIAAIAFRAKPLLRRYRLLLGIREKRTDYEPSPAGEGGPRQRWMRCAKNHWAENKKTNAFLRGRTGTEGATRRAGPCVPPR